MSMVYMRRAVRIFGRGTSVLLVMMAVSQAAHGAPVVRTVPDMTEVHTGDVVDVEVYVDMTGMSDLLGAYSMSLGWDAAVLTYQSLSGGTTTGFTSLQKNESGAASGSVLLNQFNANGASGNVHVATLRLQATGSGGTQSSITPTLTSCTAAVTFTDLMSGVSAESGTVSLIQQYQLTMVADPVAGGSLTPIAGAHIYDSGTVVSIAANPAAGYRFEYWTGGVESPASASTTVTIDADKTVTAYFTQVEYSLTLGVSPEGGGSTMPVAGVHTYTDGTVVQISANPGNGYKFLNWNGDVANPANRATTVTMSGDKVANALFKRIELWGDVNDDVGVDVGDALIIATYEIDPADGGLTTYLTLLDSRGDVDANGGVNVVDALICASFEVDSNNTYLPQRVGEDMDLVAKPASPVQFITRPVMITLDMDTSDDGVLIVRPVLSGGSADIPIGAASILITWDGTAYEYRGLDRNEGMVVVNESRALAGEVTLARVEPSGDATFEFPSIILDPSGSFMADPTIRCEILNAAAAGTFQHLESAGGHVVEGGKNNGPMEFALEQNVPNPFNPSTTIGYTLPARCAVRLEIFNIQGQLVRTLVNGFQDHGAHSVIWNADDDDGVQAGSGVYLYKLTTDDRVARKRMLLMR